VANYGYFPILVRPEYPLNREELYRKLRDNGIHGRRYFYPLISDFPMDRSLPSAARSNLPVASKAANEVICLPFYPALSIEQVDSICEIIAA
jgi:dTDP-4-amino-4,6-dideoxygalactose transaminase